jgi:hypothetical protein
MFSASMLKELDLCAQTSDFLASRLQGGEYLLRFGGFGPQKETDLWPRKGESNQTQANEDGNNRVFQQDFIRGRHEAAGDLDAQSRDQMHALAIKLYGFVNASLKRFNADEKNATDEPNKSIDTAALNLLTDSRH